MKYKCLIFILLALIAGAAAGQPRQNAEQNDEIIVYRLPEPRRVYVYQDGNVVFDAAIPNEAVIDNTFILPETDLLLNSISISQGGKRIYSYTTFSEEELVILRGGERPYQVRVRKVHVPELDPALPVDVKYLIFDSGLSWDLKLDLEAAAGGNFNCALIAELIAKSDLPETMRSILAKNPEIILASSSNALLEDSAAFFNLGKLPVEANRRRLIKLEEGSSQYKIVYHWDANRNERPSAFLRAATPLKTAAGQVQYYLTTGGIIIDDGRTFVSPDRAFDILVGEQPNIVTRKSIVTEEVSGRANLPFTHNLEYRIENQSDTAIDVEISIPVAYGEKHRTEYHFTKAPDERPGDRMLWKYTVPSGGNVVLAFSYDADFKYDPSYRQFDYSEGGR